MKALETTLDVLLLALTAPFVLTAGLVGWIFDACAIGFAGGRAWHHAWNTKYVKAAPHGDGGAR